MDETVSGFDWDDGNRAKCQQHSVSPGEVEALFDRAVLIVPDDTHSGSEERLRAIGKTAHSGSVFLVFTYDTGARRPAVDLSHQRPLHASEGSREL